MSTMAKISPQKVLPRLVLLNLIPKTKSIELRNPLKLCGVLSCDKNFVKRKLAAERFDITVSLT